MPQKVRSIYSTQGRNTNKSTWEGTGIISDIKLKRLGMYLKYYIIIKLFSIKFTQLI